MRTFKATYQQQQQNSLNCCFMGVFEK